MKSVAEPREEESLKVILTPTKQLSLESYKVEKDGETTDLLKKFRSHSGSAPELDNPVESTEKLSIMPMLGYKTFDSVYKRSIISFKDKIDTFEVSKDDNEVSSNIDVKYVNEKESAISMLAFADDIAMKEEGAKLSRSKKSESSNAKKTE